MAATLEQPKAKSKDLLPKPFGPYVMTGGRHEESVGIKVVKIAKMDGGVIETECGLALAIGREGAEVSYDGQGCRMYSTRTGTPRRVTCGEVRPGHEVILATKLVIKVDPVTKVSEPFFSATDLPARFNSRGSTKFLTHNDAGDNATLRARIAELEAQLASSPAKDAEQKRR